MNPIHPLPLGQRLNGGLRRFIFHEGGGHEPAGVAHSAAMHGVGNRIVAVSIST